MPRYSAAAIVSAIGGLALCAYIWRHQIVDAIALAACGRLFYGWAKSELGIRPRPRRSVNATKWIEALGVAYIGWRHRPAKSVKSKVKAFTLDGPYDQGEFPEGY